MNATSVRYLPQCTLLTCAHLLTACHVWKIEPLAADHEMRWDEPVRVTLATTEVVALSSAWLQRDTLKGVFRGRHADSLFVVPMRKVWRVERREFSEARWARISALGAMVPIGVLVGGMLLKYRV